MTALFKSFSNASAILHVPFWKKRCCLKTPCAGLKKETQIAKMMKNLSQFQELIRLHFNQRIVSGIAQLISLTCPYRFVIEFEQAITQHLRQIQM